MTLTFEKCKDIKITPGDTLELETLEFGFDDFNLDIKQSKGQNETENWADLDLNRLLYEMSVEADTETVVSSVVAKTTGFVVAFVCVSSFIGKFSFLFMGTW